MSWLWDNDRSLQDCIDQLREDVRSSLREVETLDADMVWSDASVWLWRAPHFRGSASFHPVYAREDLYSHSPLALLLSKPNLRVNPAVVRRADRNRLPYLTGSETMDAEIRRLGGPEPGQATLVGERDLVKSVSEALCTDVAAVEARHPDHLNVVLVGGKDSLNLLLLPWKNRTVALSARPNFELVRRFVAENDLDLEVHELTDPENPTEIEAEILEGFCRLDLRHCRWGRALVDWSAAERGRMIIWKGQLGDLYLTPKWKRVVHGALEARRIIHDAFAIIEPTLPEPLSTAARRRVVEPYFRDIAWRRAAMWQGAHVGFLRTLTGCLVRSAYHGPAMSRVWREVDLSRSVQRDLRDDIGRALLGRAVRYPTENPGPAPSAFRANLSDAGTFLRTVEAARIPVAPATAAREA